MYVKIGVVPGNVKEYALDPGVTVAQALSVAEISSDGFTITVNGVTAPLTKSLNEGDRVLLAKAIKGNL